ncbi:MAG: hypothetical protein ACLFSQ_06050 [Candidatus Zixiibacteriota bacterium]
MKKVLLLLLLIGFILGTESDDFEITIQVNYLELDILNLDFEDYIAWNPETLSFDTTIYMSDTEYLVLDNNSNVDISVSASANDRPDGYFDESYTHWDAVAAETDTNSYILRGWVGETAVIDTISSEYSVLLETPAEIIPLFPIDEMRYMLLSLTTPKVTTDRYPHEIIVNYEISVY